MGVSIKFLYYYTLVPAAALHEGLLMAAVLAVGTDALVALFPGNVGRAALLAVVPEPVVERRVVLERRGLVVELAVLAVGVCAVKHCLVREHEAVGDHGQQRAVDVVSRVLGAQASKLLGILERGELLGLGEVGPGNRGEHFLVYRS
jgi:hypothetical protein